MKAVGFDLGRTLVGSGGVPLSWKSHYKTALSDAIIKCGYNIDCNKLAIGDEILSKYNTRINYRETEASADIIFSEILNGWQLDVQQYIGILKESFFGYFQQQVKVYEDTVSTLKHLKGLGVKIGILTDVPYGMDKHYVLKDIKEFKEYVDVVLSSVDVGFRKPNNQGFINLSYNLGVNPKDMIYVGDEEKDIIGANNSGMYSVLINRTSEDIFYGQKKTIRSLGELLEIV